MALKREADRCADQVRETEAQHGQGTRTFAKVQKECGYRGVEADCADLNTL